MRDLRDPWLVAAWPGMGAVAQLAGTTLAQQLHPEPVAEIGPEPWFEPVAIDVAAGIARPTPLPRSRFFAWRDPAGRRDLLLFLGEAQPQTGGFAFCRELVARARDLGAVRAVTFAAMASPVHPAAEPRVTAVATERALLDEVLPHGAELLPEGQISGLNGVLLAAAAAAGLPGLCLLGEFPFFASQIANPRASEAILKVFRGLAGIELDLDGLHQQGQAVQGNLLTLFERLQQAAEAQGASFPVRGAPDEGEPGEAEPEKPEALDPEAEAVVENLFRQAREDRSKALELKAELDRLGVFRRYEDRFLDLFKKAE